MFWPAPLFYAPVVLCWFWQALRHRSLTLPTIANPAMECGGLCGESKVRQFAAMGEGLRGIFAPFVSLPRGAEPAFAEDRAALLALMEAGLTYPVIAKPDIGCNGTGVRLVGDGAALDAIWRLSRPARGCCCAASRREGEVGIFYVGRTGRGDGPIPSIDPQGRPLRRGRWPATLEALSAATRGRPD